jgi:hypothetical protein
VSPDENYMTLTLTLTLRISLKRRLFDFCFFLKNDLYFVLFVSFSGLTQEKNIRVVL